MFTKKPDNIVFDHNNDYEDDETEYEYEDYEDDEVKIAMMNNLFNHAIKLTEIVANNDKSLDTKEKIYDAYKQSFQTVLEATQDMEP